MRKHKPLRQNQTNKNSIIETEREGGREKKKEKKKNTKIT